MFGLALYIPSAGHIMVTFIQNKDSDEAPFKPPGCRLVMTPFMKSRDALCVKSFWRLKEVYRSLAASKVRRKSGLSHRPSFPHLQLGPFQPADPPLWSQAAGALLPFFLSNGGTPGYSKEETEGRERYRADDHRDINVD